MTATLRSASLFSRSRKLAVSPVTFIGYTVAARRQRAALRALDDNRLADLGISRADAHAEATRAAWDVPANWLR